MPHARDVGFLPFALALCRTRYRPRRVWHLGLRPGMSDATCRLMGWGVFGVWNSDVLGILRHFWGVLGSCFLNWGGVILNRNVRLPATDSLCPAVVYAHWRVLAAPLMLAPSHTAITPPQKDVIVSVCVLWGWLQIRPVRWGSVIDH
jgi:hypothetical protein